MNCDEQGSSQAVIQFVCARHGNQLGLMTKTWQQSGKSQRAEHTPSYQNDGLTAIRHGLTV